MGMFGLKPGTWSVYSETDKRWNNTGEGYGLVSMGGCRDMQLWIKQCKENFGDMPKDLESGFIKD